jgi:hypothetical protein
MTMHLNSFLSNPFAFSTTIAGFEHALQQWQALQQPEGLRGRGDSLWTSTG